MGMYLDLDDVAAGHPIAEAQLSAMREEIEMLRAEINQLRPVVEAAEGLCFGEDWNELERLVGQTSQRNVICF